jgi:hypothetical protein
VDYTREPIVETVITPKDGYRISVRSSKIPGQEEYVVEALEVITFGTNCFFRNLERPRAFMVPASDYEVLEVRETRVSLKAAILEGTVRTPPPRETQRPFREVEKKEPPPPPPPPPKELVKPVVEPEEVASEEEFPEGGSQSSSATEGRPDRRRERRRGQRRRRGGREEGLPEETRGSTAKEDLPQVVLPPSVEPTFSSVEAPPVKENVREPAATPVLSTVIPPPTTLIRDDLERLRRNKQYEGAFYIREPEEMPRETSDDDDAPIVPLRLQGDEEIKSHDELLARPQEENIYKATPAPLEDEGMGLSWGEVAEPLPSSEKGRETS